MLYRLSWRRDLGLSQLKIYWKVLVTLQKMRKYDMYNTIFFFAKMTKYDMYTIFIVPKKKYDDMYTIFFLS